MESMGDMHRTPVDVEPQLGGALAGEEALEQSVEPQPVEPQPVRLLQVSQRRHDLDSLRGIAMLLGIVLHAALSFAPIPWSVQDSQQSDVLYWLFNCIHGFRMPLFFMLSGFFTAMLWRKRGLVRLIEQRVKRILLPLIFGCFTIVPAMWVVGYLVSRPAPGTGGRFPLFEAVVKGDVDAVRRELDEPAVSVDRFDTGSGSSPLCTAVFLGYPEITELLVQAGADVNLANRDGATPLHIAVFMGRSVEAGVLLNAGAKLDALDGSGATPADLLQVDWGTTRFIAGSLGVSIDQDDWEQGRREIAQLLNVPEGSAAGLTAGQSRNLQGLKALLFQLPVFMHLWFLWFLCWLIMAFVLYAPLSHVLQIQHWPRSLISSPWCLCWLVPLTMLPQAYMSPTSFGPDASIGLLPIPSVLIYYAIFFFFGAMYWDMDDTDGSLGRGWYISLPLALLVVFPLGLDVVSGSLGIVSQFESAVTQRWVGSFLQAAFAWLMILGSIGVFRRYLSAERPTMRYLSDSSYWLYLIHLPWVLLAQWLVRDWPLPALAKFTLITVILSVLLLISYQYCVRYTWIGRLLNGPRARAVSRA